VLHLLNRDYDGATDTLRPQQGLTVQIRRDLLPERAWSSAKLHVPGAPTRELTVRSSGEQVELDIPDLSFWGIIELN
jgi:hypothetical protein